jgi:hypothetical protein
MHRSSESIGAIAAALAKAQCEMANPEKSLLGTIRSPFPREGDRTFRYAPLSSGLDIVRKSLGRQEIATIQTTSVDTEAGLIRLTTVLAHASGEWLSSDWLVCPISEASAPHRMGAALTYARRYALFTLVGIAGDDDLDAPDIGAQSNSSSEPPRQSDDRGRSNGHAAVTGPPVRRGQVPPVRAPQRTLAADLSATLRDSLVAELAALNSGDDAAAWAHRRLSAKNALMAGDAQMVEEQFQAKLSALEGGEPANAATAAPAGKLDVSASEKPPTVSRRSQRSRTVRVLGKTVRVRDKDHLKFVSRQACLVCGRAPSDPHHLRFTQARALGRRVSDEFTVPVCRIHHRELHRHADEKAWWDHVKIDPLPVALRLWQRSRLNGGAEASTSQQSPAAGTPGMSVQDRAGTHTDPRVEVTMINPMPPTMNTISSAKLPTRQSVRRER